MPVVNAFQGISLKTQLMKDVLNGFAKMCMNDD